ncbi:hypothetical protein B0H65DRAFT_582542 [Neurospora tetraspora]|uniref:Uncharacterized protein n=1 Tax=Neurospora tetraspora TaxID=94610 RepID=A0AAE0J7P0_9PEZI|nr:hypothetical protein B0H65DRAFT_582542 [Neurospora tetraspora]
MARVSEELLSRLHRGKNPATSGLETSDTEITIIEFGDKEKGKKDFWTAFEPHNVEDYPDEPADYASIVRYKRPRGYLAVEKDEDDFPVWIEWKPMGNHAEGSIEEKVADLRTLTLAEILHLPKPNSLQRGGAQTESVVMAKSKEREEAKAREEVDVKKA